MGDKLSEDKLGGVGDSEYPCPELEGGDGYPPPGLTLGEYRKWYTAEKILTGRGLDDCAGGMPPA